MDSLTIILQHNQAGFYGVVDFNIQNENLLLLDFTANNKEISANLVSDTLKFTQYINQKLRSANAKFGIGGYNEQRELYARSKVFDSNSGAEPRRLHIGIDIWGESFTTVTAPLEGRVHSFAFQNDFGDYGATLILTHELEGVSFHTLYGHLSLQSIKNKNTGRQIAKGEVIGEFGIPAENGQWPPHLHFQVIHDMQGWRGDYPGVCKVSDREKYLANCPDPDWILQMTKYAKK